MKMRKLSVFSQLACLLLVVGLFLNHPLQAAETGPTFAQLANRKLDRVELVGVTAFSQADIEPALDTGPGDLVDRGKISRTAENIATLYKSHGYEQVKIKARIYQKKDEYGYPALILEYHVEEGEPTRIGQIVLSQAQLGAASNKFWERFKPELEKKIGLNPGDLYDQEKITSAKRTIEESFASNEYIGAKVEDVIVSPGAKPVGTSPSLKAARWVSLEFKVQLGDRATFGFRGNESIPQTRLAALISEQRVVGFGKDYVESIRGRIEDEYRSLGYAHVQVTPYVFEKPELHERHVTYIIKEGPRTLIRNLQFDGNIVFTNNELKEEFYKVASDVVSHGYYVEKDVQKAAQAVIDWIKSKGYLSAKLLTINRDFPNQPLKIETGKEVDLSVYLYEGEQTLVRNISLDGRHAVSEEEARKILGIAQDTPLNLAAFTEGLEKLKNYYREKGYLSIRIVNEGTDQVITYHDENRAADVFVDISEGPQFKVTGIQIEGLTLTKNHVVQRELLFHKGEILAQSQLSGSEARLHRLGIFSSISVRALDDPDHTDGKIVRVSLQEGTPGIIAGGPGLRNDLGIRAFGEIGYSNLWGENQTVSLNLATNHRFQDFHFEEYEAQLAYIWPWFALGETTFRPTATVTGTEYYDFDADTDALALTWERKIAGRLRASFTYSLERIIQFNAQSASDDQQLRIGSITPTLSYDARDNSLNPSKGYYSSLSYELAEPWLISGQETGIDSNGNQLSTTAPIEYYRLIFRTDLYVPITSDINFYFSFRTGYERNLDSNPTDGSYIPLIEQFALGGIGSLRGIQEQALNVRQYNVQIASYANYRFQIDLPFSGALKFGPFLDVANLNIDEYSLYKNLLYSPGFSFRYQTPVGPVNLDFGFPINPPPGIAEQEFFFSIGII
jgi:outer membrane protein insertion porin family